MLGLGDLKQTRAYQEARQEEREELLTKTVPLLLQTGMSVEQIATQLDFPVETIQRFAPKTN
ncbi:hypothetical protein IQ250_10160 [Pseudanabaenaceae cyanobacterium LEGE 13415]|nr:hypothetical protein [Pseudanabaenaceae cyanobacterium LEGE 13415]